MQTRVDYIIDPTQGPVHSKLAGLAERHACAYIQYCWHSVMQDTP